MLLGDAADLVRALAEDHRLDGELTVPLAWIRRAGLGPMAYSHGRPELRADFALSSIRAEQQRAIATEAVAALAGDRIAALLLKGISYAGWLYPDPAERPMTDVDLLVREAEHPRAVERLARIGYRHVGPRIQLSPLHHAMTLRRGEATVDLHRNPSQRGRIAIPLEEVWRRARPAAWIPGALRLDEIDELLFHLANLARHDLVVPAMSFVDAARLLTRLGPEGRDAARARAASWRFQRSHDACIEAVELACGRRTMATRWWMPSRAELLRGMPPPRAVQIVRKLMLLDGPRGATSFAWAVAHGWSRALRARDRA